MSVPTMFPICTNSRGINLVSVSGVVNIQSFLNVLLELVGLDAKIVLVREARVS